MTNEEALQLLSARNDGELTPEQEQSLDIWLRELFAQAGIAVVVSVIELLLDRLQAFFQIAAFRGGNIDLFQARNAEFEFLGRELVAVDAKQLHAACHRRI